MFPMLVINPDSHRLIEQGPKQRRQFLDWGVFHVEQEFHGIWLRYMRALRQRNAALRSSRPNAASAWDAELITDGEALHVMRVAYLERLLPLIGDYVAPLAELGELSISYQPGWPTDVEFAQAIQSGLERDRAIGHTRYGPHRADLVIRLNAVAAEEAVSRGQQKLLVAGMRMAQAKLLGDTVGHPPTILVDDLPAELDAEHRAALLALLVSLGGQLFITAIEPAQIELPATSQPISVFHVEHGALREVI
jgi:DNA replication and repair protein RecF